MDRFFWDKKNIGTYLPDFPVVITLIEKNDEYMGDYYSLHESMKQWCRLNLSGNGTADSSSNWLALPRSFLFKREEDAENFFARWKERRISSFQVKGNERRNAIDSWIILANEQNPEQLSAPLLFWENLQALKQHNPLLYQKGLNVYRAKIFLSRAVPEEDLLQIARNLEIKTKDALEIVVQTKVQDELNERGFDHFVQVIGFYDQQTILWNSDSWKINDLETEPIKQA